MSSSLRRHTTHQLAPTRTESHTTHLHQPCGSTTVVLRRTYLPLPTLIFHPDRVRVHSPRSTRLTTATNSHGTGMCTSAHTSGLYGRVLAGASEYLISVICIFNHDCPWCDLCGPPPNNERLSGISSSYESTFPFRTSRDFHWSGTRIGDPPPFLLLSRSSIMCPCGGVCYVAAQLVGATSLQVSRYKKLEI